MKKRLQPSGADVIVANLSEALELVRHIEHALEIRCPAGLLFGE